MHPLRKRKLKIILFVILSIAISIGLILYALRQNINLYYTPTQMYLGQAPINKNIRGGGIVVENSIIRSKNNLLVKFKITDNKSIINISYTGILPDLFREGQGIVVQGKLINQYNFNAATVLAKHDANYMPPEVNSALIKAKSKSKSKSKRPSYVG